MKDLIHTASEIQLFFEKQKWEFCIIGGLALQFWGEQRLTRDVDITLLTGFGKEESYIDEILAKYKSRIDGAKEFTLKNRVLLLESENGIGIDISFGAFPFEESMIERAEYQKYFKEICLRICSAEDLIVMKAFADRKRDWADIESVLIKQKNLEWNYIFEHLEPLVELKEEPAILDKLIKLKKEIS
jgi:hypothetical protein